MNTDKLYGTVARESWEAVNQSAKEYDELNPNSPVWDGPYLYVFADGSWTIDYPDYIQTTNGCVSCVPCSVFNGPAELADEIESNEDWDAIEDSDDEA